MNLHHPSAVSLEEAVRRFRDLSLPFIKAPNTPVADMVAAFLDFYCTVPVEGANREEEGDMVLLEWGANCPHLIKGFVDFRQMQGEEADFDEQEYEWLGLTRQLMIAAETGEEAEESLGLCFFLYFNPAREEDEEQGGALWIPTPEALRPKLKEWKQDPYVARLLKARPTKVSAFVSSVG